MKKKEPLGKLSLQIKSQQANPSPPVGPALGQRGLNIMEFCKQFNDLSKASGIEAGMLVTVEITYYADKTFALLMKKPPVSALVKKLANLKSGAKKPGTEVAGEIHKSKVVEIAQMKMGDMSVDSLDSAVSMVMGTCVSMGIKVTE